MTQVLYASLASAGHATSDLYTVDPSTAVMTSVGPIGYACTGLAVDPISGILYGSLSSNSAGGFGSGGGLITIDTTTGAGTLVAGPMGDGNAAHDICFDASGQMWGVSVAGGTLIKIDKTNASVTVLPPTYTGGWYSGGCDFDSGGTFWHIGANSDRNATYNLTTGTPTLVSNTSDGMPYHSGKFDQFGVFWASGPSQTGSAGANLVTIDQNTGTVTIIGAFSVPGVGGLAWGPEAATGPFTLSSSPSSFTRTPGSTVTSTVTSHLVSGSPEDITLSNDNAGSLPTGVTVIISPTVITDDGGTATVTIHTTGATPLGTFSVSILGDDGMGGTAHTHITVTLISTPPGFHIAS